MKKSILSGCVFALFSMLSLTGCEKQTGDAIVIGKAPARGPARAFSRCFFDALS